MGCHTWFYKKSNRSIEEARNIVIKQSNDDINFWKNVIKNNMQYDGVDWREWEENKDGPGKGFIENRIKVLERQVKVIKQGFCDVAVYNRQPEVSIFVDGKGFFIETEYHDIFRRRKYPNDKLFSLKDTMNYINDENNNCEVFENTEQKLKEFWEKYPNGMIDFG